MRFIFKIVLLIFYFDYLKCDETCSTVSCVRASASILEKLDPSVNPCEDFYQYACGSFIENNFVADEDSSIDTLSIMNNHIQEIISKILSSHDVPEKQQKLWKISKNLYKSCLIEGEIILW